MRYSILKKKILTPIFYDYQATRLFPDESSNLVHMQLSRMVQRGDLIRIKRGIYAFPDRSFDELFVAYVMYRPSYISLETALHHFGVIPETAQNITSVTTITSKTIRNTIGVYLYSKIKRDLFFGYEYARDALNELYYPIAFPEKALLDYIYIRRLRELREYRVDQSGLDKQKLERFASYFPDWVRKVLNE